MKKIVLLCVLLFLIGGNALYAQGVRIQINGNQSFVINEENGIYFHHDTITVGGEDFALDDISVITMQVATSGIENVEEDIVKLMPNPATNAVIVQGIGKEVQTVAVYSLAGVKLLEKKASDGTVINISHLPEGVYVMRCGKKVAKIIKQL